MNIGAVTSGAVAAATWINVTRTLTGLGFIGTEVISVADTSLAAGASVDLRPAAGKFREVYAGGLSASLAMQFGTWDGTVYRITVAPAAATSGGDTFVGNSSVGLRINNSDGVNPCHYMYGGIDWS